MNVSFIQELLALFAGIALIILLTTRYRVHAFFALLIACFVTGIGVQLPLANLLGVVKDGFGNIMKSLGLIIILGNLRLRRRRHEKAEIGGLAVALG